ncbi:MAG TPA: Xaa-Pro peptidase family protein [Candidatus Limnocylindrales bacterium]|nr:Xaa-Pro peptidase family protein [Candidatus Limnocylindrales bacterium]
MAEPVSAASPVIGAGQPADAARLDRARDAMRARGVAALLIGVGADLRYLTGYTAHALERLTLLVLPADGRAALVVPRLESMAAAGCPAAQAGRVEIEPWEETDDPYALVARELAPEPGRLLVDAALPARHVLALQSALPQRDFALATEVTRDLRIVKGDEEVALLRRAAHAADRVVAQIAAGRLLGRTEADVSREVRERLVAEGHEAASFAIVGSGPNGASPHHEAGERVIEDGDPIVLDIGGTLQGYGSDITRMLWVTGGSAAHAPTDEFRRVFEAVHAAHAAATAAVRPGIQAAALDATARTVLHDAGLGDAFIHRLGHGIGLEAHEDPYLVASNREPIQAGNAFSIEPGAYLAGRFGVRIEDIVVCGPNGPDVLNQAPRDLLVVDGR